MLNTVGDHNHRICIFDLILCNDVQHDKQWGWKMSCLYPQEFVMNTGFSLRLLKLFSRLKFEVTPHLNVGFT